MNKLLFILLSAVMTIQTPLPASQNKEKTKKNSKKKGKKKGGKLNFKKNSTPTLMTTQTPSPALASTAAPKPATPLIYNYKQSSKETQDPANITKNFLIKLEEIETATRQDFGNQIIDEVSLTEINKNITEIKSTIDTLITAFNKNFIGKTSEEKEANIKTFHKNFIVAFNTVNQEIKTTTIKNLKNKIDSNKTNIKTKNTEIKTAEEKNDFFKNSKDKTEIIPLQKLHKEKADLLKNEKNLENTITIYNKIRELIKLYITINTKETQVMATDINIGIKKRNFEEDIENNNIEASELAIKRLYTEIAEEKKLPKPNQENIGKNTAKIEAEKKTLEKLKEKKKLRNNESKLKTEFTKINNKEKTNAEVFANKTKIKDLFLKNDIMTLEKFQYSTASIIDKEAIIEEIINSTDIKNIETKINEKITKSKILKEMNITNLSELLILLLLETISIKIATSTIYPMNGFINVIKDKLTTFSFQNAKEQEDFIKALDKIITKYEKINKLKTILENIKAIFATNKSSTTIIKTKEEIKNQLLAIIKDAGKINAETLLEKTTT